MHAFATRLTLSALFALVTLSACRSASPFTPGAAPAPAAFPAPPTTGAFASGSYRNLFTEWNPRISSADVQGKLNAYWLSLFGSDPDRKVYFPADSNENGHSPTSWTSATATSARRGCRTA